MKRTDFLKAAGAAGVLTVLPFGKARSSEHAQLKEILQSKMGSGGCVLIPSETAGPYPLDLSGEPEFFRQDVTEGLPGIPLTLTLTVVNINDNCAAIPNARIDIWHTDKDGVYSGFNQPGANTVGETFMRGIQITDANGQVQFFTIYPGWYPGRITHIHFEMFVNSVSSAVSQMAFPEDTTVEVYDTELYTEHGQNTTVDGNADDGVFVDMNNTQYQLLTITGNPTDGYQGSLIIGLDTPVGIINLEPETGGQFKLNQNFPNPYTEETTIPFTLKNSSDVKLELWNLQGKKVAEVAHISMAPGEQSISLNMKSLGIANSNYVYQLEVKNHLGTFRQCKMMTAQK